MRWALLLGLFLLGAAPAHALTRGLMVDNSTTITTASTQVLSTDTFRGFLLIYNPNATNTFACNLNGGTALINGVSNVNFPVGAALILDASVPTGPITCIGSGSGTLVTINVITNVSN